MGFFGRANLDPRNRRLVKWIQAESKWDTCKKIKFAFEVAVLVVVPFAMLAASFAYPPATLGASLCWLGGVCLFSIFSCIYVNYDKGIEEGRRTRISDEISRHGENPLEFNY